MMGKVIDRLTSFEYKVLTLVIAGYSRQEVAAATGAEPPIVDQTLKSMMAKLSRHCAEPSNDAGGSRRQ